MAGDLLAQFGAIIEALMVRTREGKVEWEWDRGTGTAMLINGRVVVSKDSDHDTVVEIQDEDSNKLDEINTGYFDYLELKAEANELYNLARRSALQIDSKLASILREISD